MNFANNEKLYTCHVALLLYLYHVAAHVVAHNETSPLKLRSAIRKMTCLGHTIVTSSIVKTMVRISSDNVLWVDQGQSLCSGFGSELGLRIFFGDVRVHVRMHGISRLPFEIIQWHM